MRLIRRLRSICLLIASFFTPGGTAVLCAAAFAAAIATWDWKLAVAAALLAPVCWCAASPGESAAQPGDPAIERPWPESKPIAPRQFALLFVTVFGLSL